MKARLITLFVTVGLLAAMAGKFFANSWPDGHY
jgi:hypothetical protein